MIILSGSKKSSKLSFHNSNNGNLRNVTFDLLKSIVADPHRKNADADPGNNLSADADS
jgi:hypothetical protein